MTAGTRFPRFLVAGFASVLGIALFLSASPETVQAIPITLCVTPDGTGCNVGVCGVACFASVQEAVDAAVPGDQIRVATGVYTGVHARGGMTQVVYISKTVAIRGGYSSDLTVRDLDLYPTTLDAQGQGRVVSIVSAGAPTLDGLNITGGNADGVNAYCTNTGGPSDGCGGGIFAHGSSSIIVNNVISNNVAGVSEGANNVSGGGICMASGAGAVISGNLILSNTASLGARGMGGGVTLLFVHDATVIANRFMSNTATTDSCLPGWGGG